MRFTRRALLAGAAFAALDSRAPGLAFRQNAPTLPPTSSVKPGPQPLGFDTDRDGVLFVPRAYAPGVATPLVVLLHGAGGSAEWAESSYALADELGFLILAPDSRQWTWDALLKGYGPDVRFIHAALDLANARLSVDQNRVALAGFSDGASYALSLGIGNGDAFGHLIAFSPGVMRPALVVGKPRVFISHGRGDTVMPIDDTSRVFVPKLEGLGYEVTYREFDGRHALPPEIRREAFEWFLKAGRP